MHIFGICLYLLCLCSPSALHSRPPTIISKPSVQYNKAKHTLTPFVVYTCWERGIHMTWAHTRESCNGSLDARHVSIHRVTQPHTTVPRLLSSCVHIYTYIYIYIQPSARHTCALHLSELTIHEANLGQTWFEFVYKFTGCLLLSSFGAEACTYSALLLVIFMLSHHSSLDPNGLGIALMPCRHLVYQHAHLLLAACLGVERVEVSELFVEGIHVLQRVATCYNVLQYVAVNIMQCVCRTVHEPLHC